MMRTLATATFTVVLGLVGNVIWLSGEAAAAEAKGLEIVESPGGITIRNGGAAVLEYCPKASPLKPYAGQLFTPAGVQILRDSPADHLHHHGLMFALGVDGVDFWGEAAGAGMEKPGGPCETAIGSLLGVPCARLTQSLAWNDAQGKQRLVEHREVGVVAIKEPVPVSLVLWKSELSPAEGIAAVHLDGHHYYGLGMRFLTSMDSGGRFFNSTKQAGDIVRGSERLVSAKWCAYTAAADGKTVTVAIFDHPSNPRHPNKMFTMSPPFAYLSATLNLWKEPLELQAGAKLKLSYAVAVWDGETSAEQIESLYEKWSKAK